MRKARSILPGKIRLPNRRGDEAGAGNELLIDEAEVESQLFQSGKADAFLNTFSRGQVFRLFESTGIIAALKKYGFQDICVEINTDDPFQHRVRICSPAGDEDTVLIEMVLRRTSISDKRLTVEHNLPATLDFLFVEWLLSQNPLADFTSSKPLLPGQHYPGLGIARNLLKSLIYLSRKLGVLGIATVPGHYHNAVIFSEFLKYLDPVSEGKLAALRRDLSGMPLAEVSWAVDLGCVQGNNEEFKWFLDWQVYPTTPEMAAYFSSEDYSERRRKASTNYKFHFDKTKFERERDRIPGMVPFLI